MSSSTLLFLSIWLIDISFGMDTIGTVKSASLTTSSAISSSIELEAVSPIVAAYKTMARDVICNMTNAFPVLTILNPSPWSCPSKSNLTGQWCNFTGISCQPATGQLPSPIYMQYIQLSGTKLKGSIPTALGRLTKLQRLVLDSNSIYGSIPSALGNMASLQALYLNKNSLIGTVPLALTKLTKLQVFNVNFNYMTGTLPSWFATNTYNNDTGSGFSTYVELTAQPTGQPSVHPSLMPLNSPRPTKAPTRAPSKSPTIMPTVRPSWAPTSPPTLTPTTEPSQIPTIAPTMQPSSIPKAVTTAAASASTGLSPGKIAAAVIMSIVGAAFIAWFIYKCFIEVGIPCLRCVALSYMNFSFFENILTFFMIFSSFSIQVEDEEDLPGSPASGKENKGKGNEKAVEFNDINARL